MNKPFKKIKIIVHASTIVYFIACLLTGWFKESSIAFFIVLCHEYAHTLTALALNYQVKDIHLYPFGAFVDIEDYGLHHNWQDFMVAVSGPLSYFLLAYIGNVTRSHLGEHTYQYYMQINTAVALFNLLPIWPLDGSKILVVGLSYCLDYLIALKTILVVSFMSFIALVIYLDSSRYFLVYGYLLSQMIIFGKEFYFYYMRLLFFREKSESHKLVKFHNDYSFYKPYQNFYLHNERIIDEKEFINSKIFIDNE